MQSLPKDRPEYLSTFHLLEKDRKFLLTDDLNICIIELSKFTKKMEELETGLDLWLYLLKRAGEMQEGDIRHWKRKTATSRKPSRCFARFPVSPQKQGTV